MAAAQAICLGLSVVYVGALYVLAPGPRAAPRVVRRRILAVSCVACVSWMPLATIRKGDADAPPLGQLLGLRVPGLAAAACLPVALTALLFTGPLALLLLSPEARAAHPLARPHSLHTLRDLVVAPAAEEWVFRACMAPLLWLQGERRASVVFVTPLFFSTAHVHHLRELVLLHGVPLRKATIMVAFQFAYTTLFGWYAAYVFLATGHVAAAVAVHMLCNALGFPDFGAMARHPRGALLQAATAGGIVAFAAALPRLLDPTLYRNSVFAGPCCCGAAPRCVGAKTP